MKIGDRLKDNDWRLAVHLLVIVDIDDNYVYARRYHNVMPSYIRKDRIHTDGKPRRSGFDLIPKEEA